MNSSSNKHGRRLDCAKVDDAIIKEGAVSRAGKFAGLALLIAYTIFLTFRLTHNNQTTAEGNVSFLQLQDSSRLAALIAGLILTAFYQFVSFTPIGFLSAIILPRGNRRLHRFAIGLAALVLAIMVTISVRIIASRGSLNLFEVIGLTIALCGSVFGMWVGRVWLGGWRARLWLLPKIAVFILFIGIGCGVILSLLIDRTPLSFEPPKVTSADKRELVQIARSQRPRSIKEGQTQTLQLTERHINLLLAWGLSLGSEDRKAQVDLMQDRASLWSSFGIPLSSSKRYFLNLETAGSPEFQEGSVNLNLDRYRIGSLSLPHWLMDILSPAISNLISEDPRSRPFIEATKELTIGHDLIEVTYSRLHLPPGFQEAVFGPSAASAEVLAATRIQVRNVMSAVSRLNGTEVSFAFCIEKAFLLARARSIDHDAITENRGAVFALGILLGHPRVEEFLGPVIVNSEMRAYRWLLHSVLLRGRSDWTRHFTLSAAIALLSDEAVSNAAGLLKEELDADVGGSGFSFADLLADRAGTTFAILATCDHESARAMQDRIAGGFKVDDFFPSASDLPEGIPDAELQSGYGGVGGEVYNQIIEEIERRIASCAAYR